MNTNDYKLFVFIVLFYLCLFAYLKLFLIYIGRTCHPFHLSGRRDHFIDIVRVIRYNPCNSKSYFSLYLPAVN